MEAELGQARTQAALERPASGRGLRSKAQPPAGAAHDAGRTGEGRNKSA